MVFLLSVSGQETFNVLVLGPAKHFVGSFEDYFAVAKHEKPCICDADEIIFVMKRDLLIAVSGVFGSQRKGVTHAVGHEYSGDSLGITQSNNELINPFGSYRIKTGRRLVIEHNFRFA